MSDRISDSEDLIRAVKQLSLTVARLDTRIDSRFQAFENEISNRLETVERQVDEIGGGLAVVLKRSDDTKKKLRGLPIGYRNWLSVMMDSLRGTDRKLKRRGSVLNRLRTPAELPEK